MDSSSPKILVIGSLNMDLVLQCDMLPTRGETIVGTHSQELCGGKGANQAVAAARAGGNVTMMGRVGDDVFAERIVANLQEVGIGCDLVHYSKNCSTGLAAVTVESSGENMIVVVPGANGRVSRDDVREIEHVMQSSDVVLLQLELPVETVLTAIELARRNDVRVILDPAPAPKMAPAGLFQVDLICPNESEAAALVGRPIRSMVDLETASQKLRALGAQNVAVTLGSRGTYLLDDSVGRIVPAFPITALDTTAAGDAFAGNLAVSWASGSSLEEAVRTGNAAGALAASQLGAQTGIPTRSEVEAFLAQH